MRNGFAIDPRTGEVSDASSAHPSEESGNSRQWGQRPESPSPSVTNFAANFAQRVGSLMSNMSARSPGLPTDEELEAEAERERERSRREAERILAREAEERRTVEERVMAMLHGDPESLRPPPARSQTAPATPPSPSSSQKEGSWWSMAKQRLTPTKEPLTPAQQVIQDTKAREKELEKEKKKIEKMERKRSKDWPTTPESKFEDPAFIKLGLAAPPALPMSAAPSSPSPHPRGLVSTPSSLAASPMRAADSDVEGGASPSRAPPPLYAQFNVQGALDVPGTLLTIAKRFEKLEKWTVSHVRALEERMDDVERWLVEKEREKEESHAPNGGAGISDGALSEVREEMAELQGRIGELGREMAKMVTAPGNLSSGPSRSAATVGRAPSTSSSIAVQSISRNLTSPPRSTPPKVHDTTSPTVTTPVPSGRSSRTRLPYPTGDYASPPDSTILGQGAFSPTNSPPASLTSATRARHMSIAGLPTQEGDTFSTSASPSGLPNNKYANDASPNSLPTPNPPPWRPSSASPTPRKRYTVALGTQIMQRDRDREDAPRATTPHSHSQAQDLGTAFFSTSPVSISPALFDTSNSQSADDSDGMGEETIGRTAGRYVNALSPPLEYHIPYVFSEWRLESWRPTRASSVHVCTCYVSRDLRAVAHYATQRPSALAFNGSVRAWTI